MKRSNPKRSRSQRGKNLRVPPSMVDDTIVVVPSRGYFCDIQQLSSGTGAISTTFLSGSNYVRISPYTFQGRPASIGTNFLKWRLRFLRLIFNPRFGVGGIFPTVNGTPTTTPTYASRAFAWAIVNDSSVSSSSFAVIENSGGSVSSTDRKSSILYDFSKRDKTWYYTSTTSSYPGASLQDERQVQCGTVMFAFSDTSTTTSLTYGYVTYEAVFEFLGAAPNLSILGASGDAASSGGSDKGLLPQRKVGDVIERPDLRREEQKASEQGPARSGWF